MSCERWIEALSAVADGEDPGVDRAALDAHLAGCASCRTIAAEFGATSAALGPAAQPTTASPMPDLSHRVARLAAVADNARVSAALRVVLAAVAAVIAASSIPDLLGDGEHGAMAHDARHVGAFSLAYAVGLLVVAVRPARARTMLPVAFVVTAALAVTTVLDVAEGNVTALAEGRHLPELASLLVVWLLCRSHLRHGVAVEDNAAGHVAPSLRLVGSDDHDEATG